MPCPYLLLWGRREGEHKVRACVLDALDALLLIGNHGGSAPR